MKKLGQTQTNSYKTLSKVCCNVVSQFYTICALSWMFSGEIAVNFRSALSEEHLQASAFNANTKKKIEKD